MLCSYACGVKDLMRATVSDAGEITEFLRIADLTLSGLDSPSVNLWVLRGERTGRILGSAGFECSADGRHALLRSVAVDPALRGTGIGSEVAQFTLDQAAEAGAEHAWLFSRRSGPFWQKLGFTSVETNDLASALAATHQVQLFIETGQLDREIAWSRQL